MGNDDTVEVIQRRLGVPVDVRYNASEYLGLVRGL